MKTLKRTFEQDHAATIQKTLFAIAFDYGIAFTNTQYRDAKFFECELIADVNNDKQIMYFEVVAKVSDDSEKYSIYQVVYDCATKKREQFFYYTVDCKYEVIEAAIDWVLRL